MEQYKIVIDTLGSDKGPEAVILGASLALKENPDLFVTLVGPEDLIKQKINELEMDASRIKIISAIETITNYENPYTGIMNKHDASLVLAMKEVGKDEENYAGMITAGSSGAILMGSFRYLSDEVKTRPCMAALLPNEAGSYTCLVDTGATIDCTSGQLHQFAHLGSKLMKKMYGVESPKVGLLSNGAEPTKGNHLVKETFPILAEDKELNFIGNIEGNNALSGECDVLVCDGFAGNQVLKNTEGMAKRLIKDIVILSKKRNKPEFMEVAQYLMKTYDISALGGGMVLGTRKLIIKARGNSDERAILNISKMLINYAKGEALLTKEQRLEATR
ncbi:MAG: phosphate acyltransferase PlsX [Bacilli bacterium]|nr:phosphate acyltransferase PlsX [Bacilli bacterium]